MLCHFYLRRGIVYIPTYGIVEKGFYRAIEPVAVVSISNADALRQALHDTIARGNPSVSRPQPGQSPSSVTLKHAGIKSWSEFNRSASYWGIDEEGGVFRITAHHAHSREGWKEDPEKSESFPSGTRVEDVVARMIEILQAETKQPRSD